MIHFDAPDYRQHIAAASPSGRVPVLLDRDCAIWDSLAICEYAAEGTGGGWPRDRAARAVARAAAAEMHSGFQVLRSECPMNIRALDRRVPQTQALSADIARIDHIWADCRARFGAGGDWLFGAFGIADAMFAPVAFRFRTYGAALSAPAGAYLAHVLADPVVCEWRVAAENEGHPMPDTDRLGTTAG